MDSLDWQKILRLAIVCFGGAFITTLSSSESLSLTEALTAAWKAGGYALAASSVEAVRRFATKAIQ